MFTSFLLHGLIAALVVEALVRAWGVRSPSERLRLRALGVAIPLVSVPLFEIAAPFRQEAAFRAGWALFDSTGWASLTAGGIGLDVVAGIALAASGLALYLRDAVPFAMDRTARAEERSSRAVADPKVASLVEEAAARLGVEPPEARASAATVPLLFCSGLRPVLVVSRPAIEALERDELEAAIAHEVAHAAFGDPAAGWGLMIVRTVFCFNPATQLLARAMADDIERRADVAAAAATGKPRALASAMRKLASAVEAGTTGANSPRPDAAAVVRRLAHLRRRAVESREKDLEDEEVPREEPFGRMRFVLAAAGVTCLLFFVV